MQVIWGNQTCLCHALDYVWIQSIDVVDCVAHALHHDLGPHATQHWTIWTMQGKLNMGAGMLSMSGALRALKAYQCQSTASRVPMQTFLPTL